ncbi:MAG: VanZ family protein [Candidatus Loosdrechtia sp.]|uniref:VanZ family protein n=1 Tax=Candidatus Loosdrechtia sp. TaxID=3101272 RepID=UPI003A67C338|nr:MAG: VanZ family protein [Candidatus Jettenia sp. AMX2]
MIGRIRIPLVFRCIVTISYVFLIFLMSSLDTSSSSVPLPVHMDKLIHFFIFGILCLLICWSLSYIKIGKMGSYNIIIAISITSFYGMVDEFHQYFTPNRSVEVFDWLADTAGAVVAGFLWKIFTDRKSQKPLRLERKIKKPAELLRLE